jgi:peptide-methionine (S)-S-oxide reductase
MFGRPIEIPGVDQALPGREDSVQFDPMHIILGSSMVQPFPENSESLILGMGCFWGVERKFWSLEGIYTTAVGYSAGHTPNPTYQEVCSGLTGHNEVVLVVYFPDKISLESILKVFWESHNPTEGMRQGNDQGTQYRSGIYYTSNNQIEVIQKSCEQYQLNLTQAGYQVITTEILEAGPFYYAEDYHQQYLEKNPAGYCGLGGTGVSC